MTITPDMATIDAEVEKTKQLVENLMKIEDLSKALKFLTIKDVAAATGWCEPTVRNLFNRPDFPSCDFGKREGRGDPRSTAIFQRTAQKGYIRREARCPQK